MNANTVGELDGIELYRRKRSVLVSSRVKLRLHVSRCALRRLRVVHGWLN